MNPDRMHFTLPYPPSANNYLRTTKRGRVYLTEEAKDYKRNAMIRALTQGVRPTADNVTVTIAAFRPQRRGDVDNILKVLFDALNGVAWKDDSQVVELHVRRYDDKANPRVVVTVEPDEVTPVERPRGKR